jgi:hypothetical protein
MKTTGQKEVSLVDQDSRLMRVDSQRLEVGYNIQTSVDAKQHLIVDYDVINISTDHQRSRIYNACLQYETSHQYFWS